MVPQTRVMAVITTIARTRGPNSRSETGKVSGEGSQADLGSNESVTAHERSLQLTARAEPEQARESLRGQPVRARSKARSKHRALLEMSGGRVEALDRALAQRAQRGEGARGVHDDPQSGRDGSGRPSLVQHVGVGGSLGFLN